MDRKMTYTDLVFDSDGALRRLGGDRELFADLIGFYLSDAPPLVESLRMAAESGDADQIERHAHALKGLLAGCGGDRAARAAQEVEATGRSGKLSEIERVLGTLTAELELFTRSLHDAEADLISS